MPDVHDDRSVPALAERYELGDVLGAGGTATVYRAVDRRTGRQVAVKLFDPQVTRHSRQVVEAAALGELRHPGLVELYATGSENGQAYLIMQLIDGETLAEQITRGPLPVTAVVAMGARLAETLAHVHEQGVVHRDLKPGNVLLDAEQRPYLADFGVSRLIDATRVTATGFVVGTPAYMAPEQVRGAAVGPAADVYALGLILLEALTGRREYPGDVVESAVARLHRQPVLPAQLPVDLRSLVGAMTADDPIWRPDAGAVAARLIAMQAACAPRPAVFDPAVSSRPPRAPRRWSVWLGTAAASAVLGAGALVMATAADPPATPSAAANGPTSLPAAPPGTVVVQPLAAPRRSLPAPLPSTAAAITAAPPREHGERSLGVRPGSAAPTGRSTGEDADQGGTGGSRGKAEDSNDRQGGPTSQGSAKNQGGGKNHGGDKNHGSAKNQGGGKNHGGGKVGTEN